MGRIIAIDYGRKRVGIAVTDNEKIIATPLTTVHSKDIFDFLKEYISREKVEKVIVGEPKQMDNTSSEAEKFIKPFLNRMKKLFPDLIVERFDERFTSKMAFQAMIDGGLKKKDRQDKAMVDKISATIILQSYLASNQQ